MAFERNKFKELILYIAAHSMDDRSFGVIKMAKALWFCDLTAWKELGKSITGAHYQHLENGPAARAYVPTLREMVESGDAAESVQFVYGNKSRRVTARRDPNVSVFTAEEISIIEGQIAFAKSMSADDLSEFSHEFEGWKCTREGETIRFGAALIPKTPIPLTEAEVAKARERIASYR